MRILTPILQIAPRRRADVHATIESDPMKTLPLFAAATALLALGACNKSDTATPTAENAGPVVAVAAPASGDWSEITTPSPSGGFIMGSPGNQEGRLEREGRQHRVNVPVGTGAMIQPRRAATHGVTAFSRTRSDRAYRHIGRANQDADPLCGNWFI